MTTTSSHCHRPRRLPIVAAALNGSSSWQHIDPSPGPSLHRNHDTDLADLVIVDADGHESTLHTTQHHRFWDDTRGGWVDAADLPPGDRLHTDDRNLETIDSVRSFAGLQWMYDLTVDGVHTYYVVAGDEYLGWSP